MKFRCLAHFVHDYSICSQCADFSKGCDRDEGCEELTG